MATVTRCDVCGYIGDEDEVIAIGFDLDTISSRDIFGFVNKGIVRANKTRDLCKPCYKSLLDNFKFKPFVDEEDDEEC